MASKGKTAKPEPKAAESDANIARLQEDLKQQGLYSGPIDGVMGKSTRDAVAARDAKKAEDDVRALKRLELEQSGKKIDADTAASKVETERRQRYGDQSSSAEGIAAKSAANSLAPLAGTMAGWKAGAGLNDYMAGSQVSKNNALSGVAEDRVKGLTTMEGARQGAKLSGAMPQDNALLRGTARMAPHTIIGGLGLAKGASLLAGAGGDQEYYPEQVDRAFGLGYIGAGGAMIKQGVNNAFNPQVASDAKSIAVINSNGLKRNALLPSAPAAPATPPPAPAISAPVAAPKPAVAKAPMATTQAEKMPHRERLAAAASAAGAKPGVSKSTSYQALSKNLTAENADAVAKALNLPSGTAKGAILQRARELLNTKGISSLVGPIAAAATAYAASSDPANAADGTDTSGRSGALTNAGIAGGLAYGAGKVLNALPKTVSGAMSMMGPMSVASMDEPSPEVTEQYRNLAARTLPEAMQFGAVADARAMAQVPEPSPMRQEPSMSFDDHMAELQGMLAQMGQDDGPMDNAVASQRVAARPTQQDWSQAYAPQNRLLATR